MNIKEIRAITGLSQQQFADKYHLSKETLCHWEAKEGTARHRDCPEHYLFLIERVVKEDYLQPKK